MASIVKRNKSYAVVYGYTNEEGVYKQKWETYKTEEAALKRKEEIENPIEFLAQKICTHTISDLLDEYVQLHGSTKWSFSTYDSRVRLMDNYIRPILGNIPLLRIDRHLLSRFFFELKTRYKPQPTEVTTFEIYKLLHSVFQQAMHWGYFREHMMEHINLKQPYYSPRKALSPEEVANVINHAVERKDYRLALMIHMAFSCSMRKGEILGLCWDDVDFKNSTISIKKELTRVSKDSLKILSGKMVYRAFPERSGSKSQLIIKLPKTRSSIRTVYMTPSLVELLKAWKKIQLKNNMTKEDRENDLLLTQNNGRPLCPKKCNKDFKDMLLDLGLPETVFHSLRYSSTAYKLIISGGNLKAVQGDNGHAQPNMVLSIYAQINDQDRKAIAKKLENDFCSKLLLAQ